MRINNARNGSCGRKLVDNKSKNNDLFEQMNWLIDWLIDYIMLN